MTVSAISLPHRLQNTSPSRWTALGLIVAAQFMVVLDMSIVNVALATIKGDLGFSEASLQWVVSAYAIIFGGFLLLGGRLADLLGRRRVFIAGIALFTLGSALSGLAWSAASLVAFRGIQGLGGAMFAPAGLSLLMTTFREGRERNTALGIWGAASGAGGAVGVLLGGVLTSYLSWPWIFYLNVPVGIALVLLIPRYIADSRGLVAERHFDVAGAISVTSSLMVLVYAMTTATQHGWGSTETVALLVARCRPRRGLRPRRAARGIAAAAVRGLPRHDARGRDRDHRHRLLGRLLAVLPAHALPAAGAALLRRPHRARLRGDRRHGRGHLERRSAFRDAPRPAPGPRGRPASRRPSPKGC